jgi:hypothetical protein
LIFQPAYWNYKIRRLLCNIKRFFSAPAKQTVACPDESVRTGAGRRKERKGKTGKRYLQV